MVQVTDILSEGELEFKPSGFGHGRLTSQQVRERQQVAESLMLTPEMKEMNRKLRKQIQRRHSAYRFMLQANVLQFIAVVVTAMLLGLCVYGWNSQLQQTKVETKVPARSNLPNNMPVEHVPPPSVAAGPPSQGAVEAAVEVPSGIIRATGSQIAAYWHPSKPVESPSASQKTSQRSDGTGSGHSTKAAKRKQTETPHRTSLHAPTLPFGTTKAHLKPDTRSKRAGRGRAAPPISSTDLITVNVPEFAYAWLCVAGSCMLVISVFSGLRHIVCWFCGIETDVQDAEACQELTQEQELLEMHGQVQKVEQENCALREKVKQVRDMVTHVEGGLQSANEKEQERIQNEAKLTEENKMLREKNRELQTKIDLLSSRPALDKQFSAKPTLAEAEPQVLAAFRNHRNDREPSPTIGHPAGHHQLSAPLSSPGRVSAPPHSSPRNPGPHASPIDSHRIDALSPRDSDDEDSGAARVPPPHGTPSAEAMNGLGVGSQVGRIPKPLAPAGLSTPPTSARASLTHVSASADGQGPKLVLRSAPNSARITPDKQVGQKRHSDFTTRPVGELPYDPASPEVGLGGSRALQDIAGSPACVHSGLQGLFAGTLLSRGVVTPPTAGRESVTSGGIASLKRGIARVSTNGEAVLSPVTTDSNISEQPAPLTINVRDKIPGLATKASPPA